MSKSVSSLPTACAFVVQFHSMRDATRAHCTGRVEHIVSGQAVHFASWEELQAFIEQVLAAQADERMKG